MGPIPPEVVVRVGAGQPGPALEAGVGLVRGECL
jgi:hypothetical protein